MDPVKVRVVEELIALAKDIHISMNSVGGESEDDEHATEFKRGARNAFFNVTDMIYDRIEKLIGESEQK